MVTLVALTLLLGAIDAPKDNAKPPAPAVNTPGSQFGAMEDRILAGLSVSADQLKQLKAADKTTQAKYKQLREQYANDGDLWAYVRGQKEAADWSRAETKRVLTKEQHDKYVDQWYQAMAPYLENSKKISGSRRMMPPGSKPPEGKPKP